MKKEIICTVCPTGCHITVEGKGERIASMEGYGCARGQQYAAAEFSNPMRILTSTVLTDSDRTPLVPVRSAKPVPKEKFFECMRQLNQCKVKLPIRLHDVVLQNICGTGIDIVTTEAVK